MDRAHGLDGLMPVGLLLPICCAKIRPRSFRRLRYSASLTAGATPHIYTEEEVLALLAAARHLAPAGGLRPAAYEAFFGLIAATGLRVSEAIKLRCADVDIGSRCLTVRMTKFSKSRHVPFHSTAASGLGDYLAVRDLFLPRMAEEPFFVSTPVRSLQSRAVHWTFQRLRREAGVVARGAYPEVRIHDFRHTFICRRIQRWQADGADIDNAIAALSTDVGHAKISDTYWYLTASQILWLPPAIASKIRMRGNLTWLSTLLAACQRSCSTFL